MFFEAESLCCTCTKLRAAFGARRCLPLIICSPRVSLKLAQGASEMECSTCITSHDPPNRNISSTGSGHQAKAIFLSQELRIAFAKKQRNVRSYHITWRPVAFETSSLGIPWCDVGQPNVHFALQWERVFLSSAQLYICYGISRSCLAIARTPYRAPNPRKHSAKCHIGRPGKIQRAPNPPPNLHSPVWVGSKGGRPQRGGTNSGVFVPIWPVIAQASSWHRPYRNKRTTKFVPPCWGRPLFDPTQTGLCKFGGGFGARCV